MRVWFLDSELSTCSIHYLDDFSPWALPALKPATKLAHLYRYMQQTCRTLSSREGRGSFHLSYFSRNHLGHQQHGDLPPDKKFLRTHNEVLRWLPRRTAKKREILSLIRLLQHATKAIRMLWLNIRW